MIRYLIIDDEYIAHDILKGYCDLLPDMQLMKHCYTALEAFDYLNKQDVDLLFLDLNMPVLKGFDFLKTLTNPPKVIVTTAHKEFALDGFEHNVADYLLKPFGFERFLKAIHKAFGNTTAKREAPNRIFIQSNKKTFQLDLTTIRYIESTGNYIKIVTTSEPITIRKTLTEFMEQLPKADFTQVHKSFVVATQHIRSIEGNLISVGDAQIPIGKMYKSGVVQLSTHHPSRSAP